MCLRFNEKKATQAASLLLRWRGAPMSYLKLVKLLYLADRKSLIQRGRPITNDKYFSLDKGPILSNVLNLITDGEDPAQPSEWARAVSSPANYEVRLMGEVETDELSEAEIDVLKSIFAEHGRKGRWQLVDYTHTLPEWENPHGGRLPIEYSDILSAEMAPAQAAAILSDIAAEEEADQLFGCDC